MQRTTRSIKNATTKNHLLLSTCSSTTVIQQISKQQTPPPPTNKSIAILRRIDHGDGDASINVHDDIYNKTTQIQKQHSNLSSVTQTQREKFIDHDDDEYEDDDDYENDDEDVVDDDDGKLVKESVENITFNGNNESNVNRDFITNIDDTNVELVNDKILDDFYEETKKVEVIS